jgi:hypothetical protein
MTMFMCVVHQKSVNKLDLTWKQSFLIHELDFIIQNKKGSDMPADNLSCLPATTRDPVVAAFDPFQTRLEELQ